MPIPSSLWSDCQSDGLVLHTVDGLIKLTPYSDYIIRVQYTHEEELRTQDGPIVTAQPETALDFTIQKTDNQINFSTDKLTILINNQTAAFIYQDKAGNLLTKEPLHGGKTLTPIEVVRSFIDENTKISSDQGIDGLRTRVTGIKKVVDRQAYQSKLEFEWAEGEALYGLGSHEEGLLNFRGQRQYLYQQNMKAVVPILVSTRGYGILFNNSSLMKFHDDEAGSFMWSEVTSELDYFFILGPEFDQIVQRIRQLTGSNPMLPKWAFGYIQSKERYKTQDELINIVDEYRQRKLPLDCIVLDWHSWPEHFWGQKTLDPSRFPDPDGMMAALHQRNAKLMVSIWPTMQPGGDNWKEMQARGLLLGNQATYNVFQPEALKLFWDQTNNGLFKHGVDAWWCDCTEPFEADWNGAVKPEPEERLRINTEEAKRYMDPEFINAYSLLHSKGMYIGQRQVTSEKRVINLTRSAHAGQHRYGTITWSGDITATWETLRNQIPAGLNFCITGSPYWTLDIGGFFVKNKPEYWFWSGDYEDGVADLGYRELYVRWFQLGAFLPIFRSHGTDIAREVWQFGKPGEPFYDTLVKYLRLRYRLLPYIYSVAAMVTHEDYTLMRALPFDFRHDPQTYNITDQFMFGPALMVCPVTQPMYYGVGSEPLVGVKKVRRVYLPAGNDWYDFWTGEVYSGGQTITAPAPLDQMPIYSRAGSIIPIGPEIQYTGENPNAPLELKIFPGQDGNFTLYEDEGDNYNYELGAFTKIPIQWQEDQQNLVISDRQGFYPGMKINYEFLIKKMSKKTSLDEIPSKHNILYTGQRLTVKLQTKI
ncbi:MAG: glycoside hydrolase family 31 protein [Brevefilum sp.]|nr:glycoside hydrolase family 31 protein [Brevefilum sp.]